MIPRHGLNEAYRIQVHNRNEKIKATKDRVVETPQRYLLKALSKRIFSKTYKGNNEVCQNVETVSIDPETMIAKRRVIANWCHEIKCNHRSA